MRFATFTVLFSYATLGLVQLVGASPVLNTKDMVVKRDNADIMQYNLVSTNTSSIVTATPYTQGINTALLTASTCLGKIAASPSLRKRQADDEIATLTAGIITSVTTALDALTVSLGGLPILGGLLTGIDASLNQVLLGLSILLQGVLRLVANLLTNVAQLLRNLALGLSLGTLGL